LDVREHFLCFGGGKNATSFSISEIHSLGAPDPFLGNGKKDWKRLFAAQIGKMKGLACQTCKEQQCLARRAVDEFLNKKDNFREIQMLSQNANKEEVVAWFRSGQPSFVLRQMGLWLCALRASQGQSERFWALTSRQASPIRNRLLPETKIMICNIAANWRLLYPHVPCTKATHFSFSGLGSQYFIFSLSCVSLVM